MSQTRKIAQYLFTRLRQLGILSIQGVPGDYNLSLLDYVEPCGLLWIGNTNELNAGYAADGYARIKGVGAIITTFGVGELSAVNAIAGAYAERAAVVHIVGTPARACQNDRRIIHHTLGDGDFRHFSKMYEHVTVAQANLMVPETAAQQIDQVLRRCLSESRPVYIEVPEDVVNIAISATQLHTVIDTSEEIHQSILDHTLGRILARMSGAKHPVILVDSGTRPLGLTALVQALVDLVQWPTFTTISGKSIINMSADNVYGIYRGDFAEPETRTIFEGADLVLCFGPHFSTTNTYNLSAVSRRAVTIFFDFDGITIDDGHPQALPPRVVLEALLPVMRDTRFRRYEHLPDLPRDEVICPGVLPSGQRITQKYLWRILASFLRPFDILLGETGTSAYGVREMVLPEHVKLFTPITWLSIGYMLPATLGAALAQRELHRNTENRGDCSARTILFIGDGSFQMTVQEVATIIKQRLNVVLFLINNDGYTIERCIHGKDKSYNDVSRWKYLNAPDFFNGEDAYTARVQTYGELAQVLQDPQLADGNGFRMVEITLDRADVPAGPLAELLQRQNIDQ